MSTSATEAGRELIAGWQRIESCLTEWVLQLADFNASGAYRVDGFATCQSWLEINCGIGRSTAFERVRVARELTQRPVVREAFANGVIGFAKTRVLTRLETLDDERDEKFVRDAVDSSIAALEIRVRNWNYFNGRDQEPLGDRYGLRWSPGFGDGLGQITIEAPNDMIARVLGVTDTYVDWLYHHGEVGEFASYVKNSRDENSAGTDVVPIWEKSVGARRADAFFDLIEEIALVDADKIDPDTATVDVTVQYEDLLAATGAASTSTGAPLTGDAARRLACDAGIVRIIVNGVSEILDVGRKSRAFTKAQRRAIRARHGHRCAARGCHRRITQIHHLEHWSNGGMTSIENGVPLCSYHHHLVHEGGWTITYNPSTGVTRMEGPQGQVLETEAELLRVA